MLHLCTHSIHLQAIKSQSATLAPSRREQHFDAGVTPRDARRRPVSTSSTMSGKHRSSARGMPRRRQSAALTSPSQLSVISGKTHATSSSSGSGSTVTERNYQPTRRHEPVRESSYSQYQKARGRSQTFSPSVQSVLRPKARRAPSNVSKESLNVFQFQDPEESHISDGSASESSSESDTSDENEYAESGAAPVSNAISRRTTNTRRKPSNWHQQDLHSDSGISVRGGTPDSSSTSGSVYEASFTPAIVVPGIVNTEPDRDSDSPDITQASTVKHPSSSASYNQPASPYPPSQFLIPFARSPSYSPVPWPPSHEASGPPPAAPTPPPPPRYEHTKASTKIGYEKLASQLSADGSRLVPVYRRFEALHHRVLLQLQDELSEMEEMLARLDGSIDEQQRQHLGPALPMPPASRRNDRDFGSELHAHRHDLLGRIFAKTQQYKEAMAAYRASVESDKASLPDDVAAYRAFLAEGDMPLINERETRFLEHASDLTSPGRPTHQAEMQASNGSTEDKRILLCGAVLLILLASSNTQTLMWRIVLLLAAAGVWAQRARLQRWYASVRG